MSSHFGVISLFLFHCILFTDVSAYDVTTFLGSNVLSVAQVTFFSFSGKLTIQQHSTAVRLHTIFWKKCLQFRQAVIKFLLTRQPIRRSWQSFVTEVSLVVSTTIYHHHH